jgi:chromatin assembly factor 1 subunit A
MEQQPQSTPAPTSQKRAFEDDVPVSTPKKDHVQPDPDTPLTVLSSVSTPSPLKRAAVQALDLPNGSNSTPGDVSMATSASSDAQHAKRRKLTDKEKEEKRLEKEAKDKARAEQKAQKEEEKRIKDEEKRKKNEEREEKKRAKELELQQKEEEKRKKEEEKLKKERVRLITSPSLFLMLIVHRIN